MSMQTNENKFEDIQYSNETLFGENHIKSTKILEKIKKKQYVDILNGIAHIKDKGLVIDIKFFKYFANINTYEFITNHVDQILTYLVEQNGIFIIYLNIQSLSLVDADKHSNYFRSIASYFSNKYPNRLFKCYIYNASFMLDTFLNIIKHYADKETQQKVQIVNH